MGDMSNEPIKATPHAHPGRSLFDQKDEKQEQEKYDDQLQSGEPECRFNRDVNGGLRRHT